MAYIYMDESGDLAFSWKIWTSKFFNITFLYVQNKRISDSIIKKLHQWKLWRWEKITDSFFHSCHERKETVFKWLQIIAQKDLYIMNLSINKNRFQTNFDIDKHDLYNKAVDELINFVLSSKFLNNDETINFIASRRETNKALNEKFINFLENNHKLEKIKFQIWLPINEKWLQVVDIISYAISKKYELDDYKMYDIIKDKILIEEKI